MIEPRKARQQLAPSGFSETEIWGYDGLVPGPEIRVAQGARVQRRLQNSLDQPTTIHWHGIRIDNAMDGVPGLTQDPVPPGAGFDYDFEVPDAGTYWYHSHNRNQEQVGRGLYGPLIVEESNPPDVDRDLALAVDDWRLEAETLAIADTFGARHDQSHAGRLGNLVTVNGQFDPVIEVRPFERLRLRLINTANARVFNIGLNGLQGVLVALDGMPLEAPVEVTGAFPLAPAQRADLIVDVTASAGETADLLSVERDGGYGLMRFEVLGEAQRRRDAVTPLPRNPMPELSELAHSPLHEMVMQGGAMAGMGPAKLGDTVMTPRELAQLGKFWALSGQVDRATAPFIDARGGETHRIAFVNETAFDHAMHTHGHHFRLLTPEGAPGPWRDTVLVRPGETRQVALVTDNPGDWLLHCHMLEHAASGMMSWFRVS